MKKLFALAWMFLSGSLFAEDYVCEVTPNKPDCRFCCGETFTVRAHLTKSGVPVTEGKLRCVVKWEGKIIDTREFDLAARPGEAAEINFTGTKPGWVLFSFFVVDRKGKVVPKPVRRVLQFTKPDVVAEIGAMFDGERIATQVPCPADFDAYWRELAAKVRNAPMAAELKELPCKTPGVKLYACLIKCRDGVNTSGYLAIPENAKPGSLPVVISFQSLTNSDTEPDGSISAAKSGALGFSPTWHGFPVMQPKNFYATRCKRLYPRRRGADDRETWTFRSVYLRVLRTLAFAKSRPEWNGKDLVVRGGSLGGAQSIVAAALDDGVTLAVIQVPCYCEFNGSLSGRKNANPFQTGDLKTNNINRELSPAEARSMVYYDMANFTRLIRCECYFATGFADELCPPSNVFAVYNNVPEGVKKNVFTNPMSGHYGTTRDLQGEKRLQKFFDGVKVQRYTAE